MTDARDAGGKFLSQAAEVGLRGLMVINSATAQSITSAARVSVCNSNPKRVWITIVNTGNSFCYLYFGGSTNTITLPAGAIATFDRLTPWTGSIQAGVPTVSTTLEWTECELQ